MADISLHPEQTCRAASLSVSMSVFYLDATALARTYYCPPLYLSGRLLIKAYEQNLKDVDPYS